MDIQAYKKDVEGRYTNHGEQLQALTVERYKLEGEYRLLERLEAEMVAAPFMAAPASEPLITGGCRLPASHLQLLPNDYEDELSPEDLASIEYEEKLMSKKPKPWDVQLLADSEE